MSITGLPVVVMEKIFGYLTYEEMSRIRQCCKFFQKHSERLLNDGFFQLGKQVSHSSGTLKKQLPKKESERRAHPLNRYSEVFSALETRYTLLSMTYKKYIDLKNCCFIPGKVLDVAFAVVRKMNGYLAENTSPALDVVQILRDIRDYSSMAMEHFDEHIAPKYPARPLIPLFRPYPSFESPSILSQCCPFTLPNNRNNRRQQSIDDLSDICIKDCCCDLLNSVRNEMRNKLEEQTRVIEEQRKMINEQRSSIREIVDFLGEIGKQNEWTPRLMDILNKISLNYNNIENNMKSSILTLSQTQSNNQLGIKKKKKIILKIEPNNNKFYSLRNRDIKEKIVEDKKPQNSIVRSLRSNKRKTSVMDQTNVNNNKKRSKH